MKFSAGNNKHESYKRQKEEQYKNNKKKRRGKSNKNSNVEKIQ